MPGPSRRDFYLINLGLPLLLAAVVFCCSTSPVSTG